MLDRKKGNKATSEVNTSRNHLRHIHSSLSYFVTLDLILIMACKSLMEHASCVWDSL